MTPRPLFDLRIKGRTVRLGARSIVMGVLNVTPDSFSDGGHYLDPRRAVERALEMVRQGADWIDVGGESTRPGSTAIPLEEELGRVLPVIRALNRRLPSLPISIDTTKAEVAEAALQAGAGILNDVSGLRFDPRIAGLARRHATPLVLMHLRGHPATMQKRPFVRSIWPSLCGGLARSIRRALARGVRRSQLIVDPGMGFGKSRRQNFEILAHLRRLRRFRLPILVGTSRKSFVQAVVAGQRLDPAIVKARSAPSAGGPARRGTTWAIMARASASTALPRDRSLLDLNLGDAAVVAASILAGTHIVRVHDVAAVMPAIRIADAIVEAARRR